MSALDAWLLAGALGLGALLCGQLAAGAGAMVRVLDLYILTCPQTPLRSLRPRWKGQQRLWRVWAVVCGVNAAVVAGVMGAAPLLRWR